MELEALLALGKKLNRRTKQGSYRMVLAESLLTVRTKKGRLVKLVANRAQREFEAKCGRRNIVLKARQMGISTWVAARFLLSTMTRPGTLTVQVAHTQEAAEGLFRVVHRFVENLPEDLRAWGAAEIAVEPEADGVSRRWIANIAWRQPGTRRPGRGLTIQNLHCSEVARWGARGRRDTGGAARRRATGRRDRAGATANGHGRMLLSTSGSGRRRWATCGTSFPGGWTKATG